MPEVFIPIYSSACYLCVLCNLDPFDQNGTRTEDNI